MCSKKYIKTVIVNELFLIKSMKFIFAFIIVFTGFLSPILFIMIHNAKPDLFSTYVIEISQYCFPFCASLLTIFVLRNYIENYNCEIYFLYSKYKIWEALLILIFYSIVLIIPFLVCRLFEKDMIFEYLRVVSQCFLFSSISYMILFVSMSTSITIIPVFIYLMFSIYNIGESIPFIFCSFDEMNSTNIISNITPAFIAGFLFYIVGLFINRIRSIQYSTSF